MTRESQPKKETRLISQLIDRIVYLDGFQPDQDDVDLFLSLRLTEWQTQKKNYLGHLEGDQFDEIPPLKSIIAFGDSGKHLKQALEKLFRNIVNFRAEPNLDEKSVSWYRNIIESERILLDDLLFGACYQIYQLKHPADISQRVDDQAIMRPQNAIELASFNCVLSYHSGLGVRPNLELDLAFAPSQYNQPTEVADQRSRQELIDYFSSTPQRLMPQFEQFLTTTEVYRDDKYFVGNWARLRYLKSPWEESDKLRDILRIEYFINLTTQVINYNLYEDVPVEDKA